MPHLLLIAQLLSFSAFLFYGYVCVFTDKLVPEFERYGLSHMRVLTGSLEILGALGVLSGIRYPVIGILASLGLALMMLCAIYVRIKIRDSLLETLPAIILFFVNGLILYCLIIY
jgi:hypothetical protein